MLQGICVITSMLKCYRYQHQHKINRCLKASILNYKIEAFKLAATVNKKTKTTFRTTTDDSGSKQTG
ncbi:hypothetical protein TPHV1_110014 [Treponema phagedenis]|uniref:Uncharacterized protein n=1 Tax=Treponema phagedenis TaxID=162 RepID=A0A0B7GQR6_TREPH|nr:hypothetical protein TPHV1_110014 [Treponema phagedenis]